MMGLYNPIEVIKRGIKLSISPDSSEQPTIDDTNTLVGIADNGKTVTAPDLRRWPDYKAYHERHFNNFDHERPAIVRFAIFELPKEEIPNCIPPRPIKSEDLNEI